MSDSSGRMGPSGRSMWLLRVIFIVAVVMLSCRPVSGGIRTLRGSTGTPGSPAAGHINYSGPGNTVAQMD
ncbi:hypothetical protein MHYP_G00266810 [Metynnis hypsauchen]